MQTNSKISLFLTIGDGAGEFIGELMRGAIGGSG
jgi:hypothetical protein